MATTILRIPVIHSRQGFHLALTPRFWNAAIIAGLVGGVVMAIAMMAVAAMQGLSLFAPASATAATLPVFRPPALMHAQAAPVVVGMILHLLVSIGWALAFALCFSTVPRALAHYGRSLWLGVVLGFISWLVTGMWIGPAIDPTLQSTAPLPDLGYHLLFGVVTAWTFTALIRDTHRGAPLDVARTTRMASPRAVTPAMRFSAPAAPPAAPPVLPIASGHGIEPIDLTQQEDDEEPLDPPLR